MEKEKKRDGDSGLGETLSLLQRAVAKDGFESFWVGFKSRPDWVWRLTTFLGNSNNRHALAKLPAAGGEEVYCSVRRPWLSGSGDLSS